MNGKLNLHPKVAGASLSGSLAILVVYVLSLVGIDVPTVASAALAVVLAGFGGWLAPAGYTPPALSVAEPAPTS
jgi:hypothetical protein